MAEIVEVLELADDYGRATGKYRRTVRSDEDKEYSPRGLCTHQHDTRVEAGNCPDARHWGDNLPSPTKLDEAVNRFLSWQLPVDWTPDGGVQLNKEYADRYGMPTGTNLLDAEQARAMLKHVLGLDRA